MSELDELTTGKNIEQLKKELAFQIHKMGETRGGTICSHIDHEITILTMHRMVANNKITACKSFINAVAEIENVYLKIPHNSIRTALHYTKRLKEEQEGIIENLKA